MNYQARCVDFVNGYKIVVTTDTVDNSTRIIASTYPLGSTSPININSTGFGVYPDAAALDADILAAIDTAKNELPVRPPTTIVPSLDNLPDPITSATRPSVLSPGPAQTPPAQQTDILKPYRQTVGSETPSDVARDMMGIISSVKASQSSYVDSSGRSYGESLKGTFERLIGLKSNEIPEGQLLANNQKPFVYFVYSLLHDKTIVQSIDGKKGLTGQGLTNQLYITMVKRLGELDGHNLAAVTSAADAMRTTGAQILSTITGAKAGVTPAKQKLSADIARQVDRAAGVINTIEDWGSNTFFPDELKTLFGEDLKLGSVDYVQARFGQNDAGNVFVASPATASIMQGTSLSFAFLNTGADTMRQQKLDILNRVQTYAAKNRYYGDVYSVLVDGKGLENDPNTLTMKTVVAYFAACLKTIKGTCSECKYYSGASSTSQSDAHKGATQPNKKLTCAFGFVNPNNTSKGPDDYCWFDSIAPGRGASGVKYELNAATSKRIRKLAASLVKK